MPQDPAPDRDQIRLALVSGLSGSGKSIALHTLEDCGYYCVDNLPVKFLRDVARGLIELGHRFIALSVDARGQRVFTGLDEQVGALRALGCDVRLLFLTASTPALVRRFSETRRRHPLTLRGEGQEAISLHEAINLERHLLSDPEARGHVIDTTDMLPASLRDRVRELIQAPAAELTLSFESFAFKRGIPVAADLVFDVRNLPNPYWQPELRPLTGLDGPVVKFLEESPLVGAMIGDIAAFIERWLPSYLAQDRHYLNVAIGCTGGQHRSVYVAERLRDRFRGRATALARHRQLETAAASAGSAGSRSSSDRPGPAA